MDADSWRSCASSWPTFRFLRILRSALFKVKRPRILGKRYLYTNVNYTFRPAAMWSSRSPGDTRQFRRRPLPVLLPMIELLDFSKGFARTCIKNHKDNERKPNAFFDCNLLTICNPIEIANLNIQNCPNNFNEYISKDSSIYRMQ